MQIFLVSFFSEPSNFQFSLQLRGSTVFYNTNSDICVYHLYTKKVFFFSHKKGIQKMSIDFRLLTISFSFFCVSLTNLMKVQFMCKAKKAKYIRCMRACVHVYACLCTCIRVLVNVCTRACVRVYACTSTCVCMLVYACLCTRACVRVYACLWTFQNRINIANKRTCGC